MLDLHYTEKLLGLQGVEVKKIQENEENYEISIEQPRKNCLCPCCGKETNKIHDYRSQRIRELPAFEKRLYWFFAREDMYAPAANVLQNQMLS